MSEEDEVLTFEEELLVERRARTNDSTEYRVVALVLLLEIVFTVIGILAAEA
jgi:hypothetical protein